MGAVVQAQPATDARTLAELEEIISRGKESYVEMGLAFRAIRDGRKYRAAGFADFDTYCRTRQQMTRRNADRIIKAAEVGLILRPFGLTPKNEWQARDLEPLLARLRGRFGGDLTESQVKEAVSEWVLQRRKRISAPTRFRGACRPLMRGKPPVEAGSFADAIGTMITYGRIAKSIKRCQPEVVRKLTAIERALEKLATNAGDPGGA